jgi:hypothetical protein
MKYQLVLHFQGDALADYDVMIALEDKLRQELAHSADVDGHDVGSGETNIFIFTRDPKLTFWVVRQVLLQQRRLESVTAAYRPVGGEKFTVIWPEGSTKEFTSA